MSHSVILLLPTFMSLFWAVTLFLRRKENWRAQNYWIVALLLMGVSTYIWSLYFSGINDYHLFYKLELLEGFTTLLLIPFLHYGFKTLTEEKPFGWKDALWLLPALLIGGSMTILYLIMGDEQAAEYIREVATHKEDETAFSGAIYQIHHLISVEIYALVVFGQILIVLFMATKRLIGHRHRLRELFSSLDGKSVHHRALLVGLYLVLLLSLVTYRGRFHYADSLFIEVVMLIWGVLIYYMGYHTLRLNYTADAVASDLARADQEAAEHGYALIGGGQNLLPETNEEAAAKRRELIALLHYQMDKNKIYLQKELRLVDLARVIRTNRTYLSRLINDEYQCSFSDYINAKRVEHAQQLVIASPGMSQDEIAYQSGFQYTSSFSRIFKQHVGITFRDWRKEQGL